MRVLQLLFAAVYYRPAITPALPAMRAATPPEIPLHYQRADSAPDQINVFHIVGVYAKLLPQCELLLTVDDKSCLVLSRAAFPTKPDDHALGIQEPQVVQVAVDHPVAHPLLGLGE